MIENTEIYMQKKNQHQINISPPLPNNTGYYGTKSCGTIPSPLQNTINTNIITITKYKYYIPQKHYYHQPQSHAQSESHTQSQSLNNTPYKLDGTKIFMNTKTTGIQDIRRTTIQSNGHTNIEDSNNPSTPNQNISSNSITLAAANNPNTIRSRHTLLIQDLPHSIISKKIEEIFEVFGEIDNVIVNPDHTCYVRMKRSQDARKIVHLFKYNHAGVIVAPYGASKMTSLVNNNKKKEENNNNYNNITNKLPMNKPIMNNYATAPNHNYNNRSNQPQQPNLINNRRHDNINNRNQINNNNTLPQLPIQMQRTQFTNSQTMNSMPIITAPIPSFNSIFK